MYKNTTIALMIVFSLTLKCDDSGDNKPLTPLDTATASKTTEPPINLSKQKIVDKATLSRIRNDLRNATELLKKIDRERELDDEKARKSKEQFNRMMEECDKRRESFQKINTKIEEALSKKTKLAPPPAQKNEIPILKETAVTTNITSATFCPSAQLCETTKSIIEIREPWLSTLLRIDETLALNKNLTTEDEVYLESIKKDRDLLTKGSLMGIVICKELLQRLNTFESDKKE